MNEGAELLGRVGDALVRVVVWIREIQTFDEESGEGVAYEYGVRAYSDNKDLERTSVRGGAHVRLLSLRDASDLIALIQNQGVDHDEMLKELGGELRLMPAVIYRTILLFVHFYIEVPDRSDEFLVTISFPDLEATGAISTPAQVDLFCSEDQLNEFGKSLWKMYERADRFFYPDRR